MSIDDLIQEGIFEERRIGFLEEDPNIISPADMKLFFSCPYAYHLKKNLGMSKIPRTAFSAMAMFFANARRMLFRIRDQNLGIIFPYQTRAWPDLKLAEEMTQDELREYLGARQETFGKIVSGRWLFSTKAGIYAGSPLVWSFKSQSFKCSQDLKKASDNYYKFVLENGAPILGYIDKEIVFDFEGHKIKIKLPELRPGIIDDPTLWNFNADCPDEETNLAKSILVTMRLLGYTTSIANHNFYRMKWKVPGEVLDKVEINPIDLLPKIRYRHINALTGVISETRREERDLELLRTGLNRFLNGVAKEDFQPNHKSCGICQYNCVDLNGDVVCQRIKAGSKPQVPGYYFKKKSIEIEEVTEDKKITLRGRIKKDEEIKKPLANLVLLLDDSSGELQIDTHYYSQVRGIGIEESFIKYIDKRLKQLRKERKIPVNAVVHFERDFKFAGQRKIETTLGKLKYTTVDGRDYAKRY